MLTTGDPGWDRAGGGEISSPYLKPMNCLFWNILFNIFEPQLTIGIRKPEKQNLR